MMRKLLINWLISAVCLFALSYVFPGITVESFGAALIAAFALGFVNAVIRPLIIILTLPVNILTLGLFTFVINALMLMLASAMVSGFSVSGFWTAFLAALVLGILKSVLEPKDERK